MRLSPDPQLLNAVSQKFSKVTSGGQLAWPWHICGPLGWQWLNLISKMMVWGTWQGGENKLQNNAPSSGDG